MKAIAIHFEPRDYLSACQIYRVNVPFHQMSQHGHVCVWEKWENIRDAFLKEGRGVFVKLVQTYDLFVFPRLTAQPDHSLEGLASLFKLIRVMGKRIIYEVDDDFTNQHRNLEKMGVHRATEIASWCDANTVTTPFLADLMTKATGRKSYVLPNMLEPSLWKRTDLYIPHGDITIGLSGSPTHYEDWKVLEDVLPRIMAQDYGVPVRLLVTGYHPSYLREVPGAEMIAPAPYEEYAEIVRTSDIVLAPVNSLDHFNDYKSPIKVVEGMGASRPIGDEIGGAACIATDNVVYSLAIEDGKTGLLCSQTPEAWYNAIDSVLRDSSLRFRLSVAGHALTWKRYDITKTWADWVRAYYKVLEKPANAIALPIQA